MKTQTFMEYRDYQNAWFKTPRGRYHQHKGKALARGIEWRLTFEEWWGLWQTSGKWEQRGRRRDQYVMARFGDQGAYERDNVRICLAGENTEEMRRGLPPREWRGEDADKTADREAKRRLRENNVRVDPVRAAVAFNRRMIIRDGRRCWAHPGDRDYPG